jgi:hypothetical protein
MTRKCETKTAQAPDRPRTRRRGGQPGNRNAARPVPSLLTQVRALRRRIHAALRIADAELAARRLPRTGGPPKVAP